MSPTGLCKCGCGQKPAISHVTDRSKGWVRGEPKHYVLGHGMRGRKLSDVTRARMRAAQTGEGNGAWNGGRKLDKGGYVLIWLAPDHPLRRMANTESYVREHRLAMAEHIGRPLDREETVHHKNGVVDDNRIENLLLCSSHGDHARLHAPLRRRVSGRFA